MDNTTQEYDDDEVWEAWERSLPLLNEQGYVILTDENGEPVLDENGEEIVLGDSCMQFEAVDLR